MYYIQVLFLYIAYMRLHLYLTLHAEYFIIPGDAVDRRKIRFHFLFFKKQQFKASLELKFDFNHAAERQHER